MPRPDEVDYQPLIGSEEQQADHRAELRQQDLDTYLDQCEEDLDRCQAEEEYQAAKARKNQIADLHYMYS